MRTQPEKPTGQLPNEQLVAVLLEEYRALHGLLLFRLSALERRLPAVSGFITVGLAGVLALPVESQTAVLVASPIALLWLSRTTVQHAKAKEDNLRRIDEIEQKINEIAGCSLLEFQSRHQSRMQSPAGRSGSSTVLATAFSSIVIVLLCLLLFLQAERPFPESLYFVYAVASMLGIATAPLNLKRYRYRKRSPEILMP